jgi:hypothetical protein
VDERNRQARKQAGGILAASRRTRLDRAAAVRRAIDKAIHAIPCPQKSKAMALIVMAVEKPNR